MTTILNFLDIVAKVCLVASPILFTIRLVSLLLMRDLIRVYSAYGTNLYYDNLKGPVAIFMLSAAWLIAPYV
jgi:hypothetical protein